MTWAEAFAAVGIAVCVAATLIAFFYLMAGAPGLGCDCADEDDNP